MPDGGLKQKMNFVIPHNWHLQDKQWLQAFAFKEQPQKLTCFQRGFSSKERGKKAPSNAAVQSEEQTVAEMPPGCPDEFCQMGLHRAYREGNTDGA